MLGIVFVCAIASSQGVVGGGDAGYNQYQLGVGQDGTHILGRGAHPSLGKLSPYI